MKKVCVAMAPGFEEIEALSVVDYLTRAGIDVIMAGVPASADETKCGQMEADGVVIGAHGIPVRTDLPFAQVEIGDLDAIVLPGGMPGTLNLEADNDVREAVADMADAGKYVAAICAAPALVLGKYGYLKGRKATCYPGMEGYMEGALAQTDAVVQDGNFITSRGPGTAVYFALKLIEVLIDKDAANKIAKQLVL